MKENVFSCVFPASLFFLTAASSSCAAFIIPLHQKEGVNEATRQYIATHADDDVRKLALQGCRDGEVDMAMALQQIQGRQTARLKLPTWAACEGILYPPHLNMEQCSSEQTARYKARVLGGFCSGSSLGTSSSGSSLSGSSSAAVLGGFPAKKRLVDLTGGLGVDFSFMCRPFEEAVYVEQQKALFAIAQKNFQFLFPPSDIPGTAGSQATPVISCICADGVEYLHQLDYASLIYLDPARRDGHGSRTYSISDCTPNVLPLLDELLAKAERVMLKLSPMLDWRKAVSDVGQKHVEQVHIVSVDNECKELLLVLSAEGCQDPQLVCVNNDTIEIFRLTPGRLTPGPSPRERGVYSSFADISSSKTNYSPLPGRGAGGESSGGESSGGESSGGKSSGGESVEASFLYEPNASLMKAGVFSELARRYGVTPLAQNSHLFTSEQLVDAFPGRVFRISAVSSMNKQELRAKISPLQQANISVRNFPLGVAELRKRLKLSEGGSNYLFATTLAGGKHVLIVCQRV